MKFSKSTFEEIRKGLRPAYHLLNPCELDGISFPHLVVNFGQVSVTHFDQLAAYANTGARRVRLLHPYREHLAQAFARFVMRVGLPQDIDDFPRDI